MLIKFTDPMRQHVEATVRLRSGQSRVLDVYAMAHEIQAKFTEANVALEDIAAMVAEVGARAGCALELNEREESTAQSA